MRRWWWISGSMCERLLVCVVCVCLSDSFLVVALCLCLCRCVSLLFAFIWHSPTFSNLFFYVFGSLRLSPSSFSLSLAGSLCSLSFSVHGPITHAHTRARAHTHTHTRACIKCILQVSLGIVRNFLLKSGVTTQEITTLHGMLSALLRPHARDTGRE